MKQIVFPFGVILLFLLLYSCQEHKTYLKPQNLTIEYKKNPLGLENMAPRFSWFLNDTTVNASQTAWHIIVSGSKEKAAQNIGDVWDSKKISSDQSQLVKYTGPELQSGQKYFWRARFWDKKGQASQWSDISYWEMGLLNKNDWKANWITYLPNKDTLPSIAFRKSFAIDKKVVKARLYITGLGNYVSFLNGEKIGEDLLTPGWTHFPKKIQYQVYDITAQLKTGENILSALTGKMWWSSGLGWRGGARYSKGPLKLYAQLNLEFEDGQTQVIASDNQWKANISPIWDNHLYHGEKYDARILPKEWQSPGFDDSSWENAVDAEVEDIDFVAQQGPTIQVTNELSPKTIKQPIPGTYVFDFGQNIVGRAKLKVSGKKGDTITMKFAELLHEDGTVAQENLRSAKATDKYVIGSDSTEVWAPHFTYHGFRYAQVTGVPSQPDKSMLTAQVFHSNVKQIGEFSCSDKLLNKIQSNIQNGTRANLMSVPTDCPQRDERLGWTGDAQIFAPTGCYNFHLASFFAKWERDITDCQHDSGYVYDVNPQIVVGTPAKPGWGDAVAIIPWVLYTYYGDTAVLEENYDAIKAWVEYMRKKSVDNIYICSRGTDLFEYGDWIAVEASPKKPIGAAYYYYSTYILTEIAKIIGNKNDEAKYKTLANDIAKAFHDKYYKNDSSSYHGSTQTANLLPLVFGITPDNLKSTIAETIYNNVLQRGTQLSTGFLGTRYILPVLSDYGHHETAATLALQKTYPSLGYMAVNGATSIWELWNSDKEPPEKMNSRNHFALGSLGEWYYSHLAGIKPDVDAPGYKNIILAPQPTTKLDWVKASVNTGYGKIQSNWKKIDGGYEFSFIVPPNTTADIILPLTEKTKKVLENDEEIYPSEKHETHFKEIIKTDKGLLIKAGAGTYVFFIMNEIN